MKPTAEMINAAKLVLVCMAYEKSVRPIIEKIQSDMLAKKDFFPLEKYQDRGRLEPVKNWSNLYLLSDKDSGYILTEVHSRYLSAGFKIPFGYCPLLTAENETRKAKEKLVNAMQPITKLSYMDVINSVNGLENLAKLVDLNLRFLSPYVKIGI